MWAPGGKRVTMLLANPATHDPRPLTEAHALASAGCRVTILAWDREGETKRDSSFSDGVTIRRMRLRAGHGTPLLTVPRLLIFYAWCVAHLLSDPAEVIHAHDVDTLPAGLLGSSVRPGAPALAYDMHDLPEAFLRFFPLSQFLQRVFLAVCRKRAKLVIVASEGFIRYLTTRGYSRSQLSLVLNSPRSSEGRPPFEREGQFDVLYYGGLEEERGVRLLLELADDVPNIRVTMAGRGSLAKLADSVARKNPRVRFLGWLGPRELKKAVSDAWLIPSMYNPTNNNIRLSTPGKLLKSLSLSIPVLVPAGTFQAELVKKHGCGLVVDWGDRHGLAQAVLRLSTDREAYTRMTASAYQAFSGSLNWEASEVELLQSYARILSTKNGTPIPG